MDKKIIITDAVVKNRAFRLSCLVSDRRLEEVRCESIEEKGILGNIYVGRVQRIVKNLRAAFIEIAPGKACYYSMEGKREPVFVKKMPSPNLVQGDELLVQVEREGIKTKAPVVTTNLNLSGRYVVLTSENLQTGYSSKLKKSRKEQLGRLLESLPENPFGFIFRTNAGEASDAEIAAEIQHLTKKLSALIQNAASRTCFSCVYHAGSKHMSYLQNTYQEGLSEIVTDIPVVFEEMKAYYREYPSLKQIPLRLYEDPKFPLSKLYNLEKQMEHALEKKVWLKSGGYLVIEPTEALTVIDVNTGKSIAKKDPQKHFLKTNMEAADEIAHQLRLRNISGIIIIDFINLSAEEDQRTVLDRLRRAVKNDSSPVQVLDMTKLNLAEVTRKKTEKSLAEQILSYI